MLNYLNFQLPLTDNHKKIRYFMRKNRKGKLSVGLIDLRKY